MRVFYGCGLYAEIDNADLEKLENGCGTLEAMIHDLPNIRVFLHITEEEIIPGMEEVPGFHIEATPSRGGIENRQRYDIYLASEHFKRIIQPRKDAFIPGVFASRSFYDRISVAYMDSGRNEKL
ncbi:MAG: hypothetical protein ABIJ21_02515 [Nanoarchaeota archaeon]